MKNQNDIETEPFDRPRNEESGTWKRDKKKYMAWIAGLAGAVVIAFISYVQGEWNDAKKTISEHARLIVVLQTQRQSADEAMSEMKSAMQRVETKIDQLLLERGRP